MMRLPRTTSAGFTLIEVMAALLILGLTIFALVGVQTQAVHDTATMKKKAFALAAAETALDDWLASPLLTPNGDVFDSDETLTLPGFTDAGLTVHRLLKDHTPLNEQDSIYENPGDDPSLSTQDSGLGTSGASYISTPRNATSASTTNTNSTNKTGLNKTGSTGAGSTSANSTTNTSTDAQPFDPGTFISVRIEVYDNQHPETPLAALEAWVPRPVPIDASSPTATGAAGTSSTGATAGTGSTLGGKTNTGSTGAGGTNRTNNTGNAGRTNNTTGNTRSGPNSLRPPGR